MRGNLMRNLLFRMQHQDGRIICIVLLLFIAFRQHRQLLMITAPYRCVTRDATVVRIDFLSLS